MKKTLKVLLSVILCLSICLGLAAPSFAANEKTAFILVSGMGSFPLLRDGKEKVFPMSNDVITEMVAGILPPVLSFLATRDYDALGDGVLPPLTKAFAPLACDADGNSIENVDGTLFEGSLAGHEDEFLTKTTNEQALVTAAIEKYGVENAFFFNYDWRMDPLDHADKLDSFIKMVRSETKCDKLAVAAYSMGGTIVCSYLYKYGSADVDRLLLCSTAFQGTSCMGAMFSGGIEVDMWGLFNRFAHLVRDNTMENVLEYINVLLSVLGVNARLDDFVNGILINLNDRIYGECLIPIFGYMPGLWALVEDENYEKAKDFMLDETVNAKLIKRIDEYHYNVQAKAAELLRAAESDTSVYITAQYNMQGLPVAEVPSKSNNDYLIDAQYASGGATCSLLGETLGDGYVQKIDCGHNHLSCDGEIDASTCMLPETTWFIRDMGHVDYPLGEGTDFVLWLASTDKVTVHDDDRYPQFLRYNYDTGELKPLTEDMLKETPADIFFDMLENVTVKIFEFLASVIESC